MRPPRRSKAASGTISAFGEDLRRIRAGLAHAEAALDQHVAGLPEAPARVGMEDLGEGDILPALEERLHERARIDLAADRPIGADGGDAVQVGKVESTLGEFGRRPRRGSLRRAHRGARASRCAGALSMLREGEKRS